MYYNKKKRIMKNYKTIKEWENSTIRPLSLKWNTMNASKNNASLKYKTLSEWCVEEDKKQNNK